MKKRTSIFLLFLLVLGCDNTRTSQVETGNDILDKLLHGTESSVINLDQAEVDTLIVLEENIRGKNSFNQNELPDFIGRISGLIISTDDILVADGQQHLIWVMDDSGIWKRVVGGEGEGPGEFRNLFKIMENSRGIYTVDRSNSRVQIYDHQLNLKDTFNQPIFGISDEQFSVSDEYLFFPSNPYADSLLISVRSAGPPFEEIHSFLPTIIPAGYQPAAYNMYHSNSNYSGQLALTYVGTPYLLIFDENFKIDSYIKIESSFYSNLDNPGLAPISSSEQTESGDHTVPGVKSFMYNIKIDNDDNIYIVVDNTLYRLVKSSSKYSLDKGWMFKKESSNSENNQRKFIQLGKYDIQGELLIMSTFSENEILRFNLSFD